MKLRILLIAILALLILPLQAAVTTLFTASTATGASSAVDTGNAKYVRVHVYRSDDPAASTAVLTIQQSLDGLKWFTVATITNPTGMNATTGDGGEIWGVVSVPYTRVYRVSHVTGSLTATIDVQR